MAAVTDRRAGILQIIVREYVETAAPVGSRTIHDKYGVPASPATIRHEMQALEEEGLLEQPHTSAGRVPSDLGYRYFVESLMGQADLPVDEQATIRHQFFRRRPSWTSGRIWRPACWRGRWVCWRSCRPRDRGSCASSTWS